MTRSQLLPPLVATLLFLALLPACIVEAPGGEKQGVKRGQTVVSNAPPLTVTPGANLEDKIELVSATFTPGRALPGEAVKVAVQFRVLEPLEADYTVFVHLEDVDGRAERMNIDHKPVQGTYPTPQWKKGEVVKDEFNLVVPPGGASRGLNIYLGLWDAAADTRLKLKNTDKVKSDGNNRILIATLPIGM